MTARTSEEVGPAVIWNVATTAIQAVQMFYKGRNWFNCDVVGFCPESEVHREATRIINELGTLIEQQERDTLMARALFLLDEAERHYRHTDLLTPDQEDGVVTLATAVHREFYTKLRSTIVTDAASVESAYRLARMFNLVSAMVDDIGQIALNRGKVAMDWQWIQDKRNQTMEVNEALVGSQNLWYNCPAGPSEVSNVATFSRIFATRKLWKKFADYRFGYNSFGNDCNVFRRESGQRICNHDCNSDFLHICKAGVLPGDEDVYKREMPRILAKMNRDPIVRDIRQSMEAIAGAAADHAGGLLWQTSSGIIDTWKTLSPTSYSELFLNFPAPGWEPAVTGDFDGDGDGDIILHNATQLSLLTLDNKRFDKSTPPTTNAPLLQRNYSGDLDGDGISDVIWTGTVGVGTPAGSIAIYISETWWMNPGSTTPRQRVVSSSQVDQVQGMGNFDNDAQHRADVLYRAPADGTVSVSLNGGATFPIGWAGLDWQIKGVGDFNRDGFSDILWYNVNSGGVAVWTTQNGIILQNTGPGASAAPSTGWAIQGVTDIDHDGFSDIVWRHSTGLVSHWMMAGPDAVREFTPGQFMDPSTRFVGTVEFGPKPPANMPIGAIQEPFCNVNGVLRNPGFAGYETWWNFTLDGGRGVFSGDVDGDNRADMVTVSDLEIAVARSTGTGFGPMEDWRWDSAVTGDFPTMLGDVTGDGLADLVSRGNGWVRVRRSNGAGFGNPENWWNNTFHGNRANFLADVDGDGKQDLVGLGDGFVGVIRSTGGAFGAYQTWLSQSAFGTRGTLMGDVNADGRADIVALNDNDVRFWLSNGTSFFGGGVVYGGPFYGSHGTLLGDVNGDGMADLVALEDNQVRVMRSFGSYIGNVENANPYYESWWSRGFYGNHGTFLGDIDGNMRMDLIADGDGFMGVIRSQ